MPFLELDEDIPLARQNLEGYNIQRNQNPNTNFQKDFRVFSPPLRKEDWLKTLDFYKYVIWADGIKGRK